MHTGKLVGCVKTDCTVILFEIIPLIDLKDIISLFTFQLQYG